MQYDELSVNISRKRSYTMSLFIGLLFIMAVALVASIFVQILTMPVESLGIIFNPNDSAIPAPTAVIDPFHAEYIAAKERAVYPSGPRPKPYASGVPALYPELRYICACESSIEGTPWGKPRQFENGKVLWNYDGSDDVGMCQINLSAHEQIAKELGYNLFETKGNINYANLLFEREGSAPWFKSEGCWRKMFEKKAE